jgi:RsiW-degrading membrane proteinase PrsW (M82 family)
MSDTLNKIDEVGAETLGFLSEFAKNGIGFIEEQAPLLCEEIISYHKIMSCIWMGMIVTIVLCIIYTWYKVIKLAIPFIEEESTTKSDVECVMWYFLMGLAATLTALPFILTGFYRNLSTIIQTTFAPRLFLMEYFAEMVS